jgi:acetyl esterase/lipase
LRASAAEALVSFSVWRYHGAVATSLTLLQPAATCAEAEAYRAIGNVRFRDPRGQNDPRVLFFTADHGLWPKEVVGHDPNKEPRAFYPYCPTEYCDYAPTMLFHGDKDTDVPFEQSVQMATELERHHVEHEFIRIRNGGHGFDTGQTFDRVLAFLDKHLK